MWVQAPPRVHPKKPSKALIYWFFGVFNRDNYLCPPVAGFTPICPVIGNYWQLVQAPSPDREAGFLKTPVETPDGRRSTPRTPGRVRRLPGQQGASWAILERFGPGNAVNLLEDQPASRCWGVGEVLAPARAAYGSLLGVAPEGIEEADREEHDPPHDFDGDRTRAELPGEGLCPARATTLRLWYASSVLSSSPGLP